MIPIRIAAALVLRADGRTLLVRKRDTRWFMQPGGKIDAGETAEAALSRELHEELGVRVAAERLQPLGQFEAAAANEPGQRVDASLFLLRLAQAVRTGAEIAELAWIDPAAPGALALAPLTRDDVLPMACRLRAD